MCLTSFILISKHIRISNNKLCFDEMQAGLAFDRDQILNSHCLLNLFSVHYSNVITPQKRISLTNAEIRMRHLRIYLVKPFIKSPYSGTCPAAAPGSVNRRLTFNILNHFSFQPRGQSYNINFVCSLKLRERVLVQFSP